MRPQLDHRLQLEAHSFSGKAMTAAPDTLRVLAAMIAFQEDNDSRTSGNGTFDLSIPTRNLVDPPPHDKSYFEHHLTFARNYFRKSSNGKFTVVGTVLDSVYRLPNLMRYYSPSRNSTDNRELGLLFQDAWKLVDSVTPGISFSDYDAFVIFHAGAGRDIDLASILGANPTPFDIPSLYLNLPGLQKMFGASYQGVAVQGGAFHITSTMIVPETESREVPTLTGNTLLELGMNGILVASIGSHLGLPDLFDTKTGRSGIGRFGLMDGQSIFSWNGVFPPEPSAWEKYFLGWVDPITITRGDTLYSLPAVSLAGSPDTVYKVLISEKEYFLVENRNRDANRDSATITCVVNGETISRRLPLERNFFDFDQSDLDSLYGIVTDVDEFDWSLPGGVVTSRNELFDGGILIWHIDEGVIDANYSSLAVNANPERRGVDVEEADGSQDIGQNYGSFNTGSGSEFGTPLDFWYSGNRSPLRIESNAFSPTSNPNSLSNDFANSHVTISNFSERSPRMTARIKVGDSQVSALPGFPKNVHRTFGKNSLSAVSVGSSAPVLIATTEPNRPSRLEPPAPGNARIFAWTTAGQALPGLRSDGLVAQSGADSSTGDSYLAPPVATDFDNNTVFEIAISQPRGIYPAVTGVELQDLSGDSLPEHLYSTQLSGRWMTTHLVGTDSVFAVGCNNAQVVFLKSRGDTISGTPVVPNDTSEVVGVSVLDTIPRFIAVTRSGVVAIVSPMPLVGLPAPRTLASECSSPAVSARFSSRLGLGIAAATKNGKVHLLTETLEDFAGFPVATGGEIANAPALADIDGDGSKEIVVFSGNKIWAINATGALLNNYPIVVPSDKPILTSPIVADIDGNGTADIIGITQEGLVVAYDKRGMQANGFPLLAGSNSGSTPAAFYLPSQCLSCVDIGLAAASDDGHVYAWKTGTLQTGPAAPPPQPWPQFMHDARNTGSDGAAPPPFSPSPDFFPVSQAYNWPNPVGPEHNFKTHIRYYVGQDATVTIKVFDLAGDLVTSFENVAARGGFENEFEWDVSSIQSGIYFAHLEADGGGENGKAVIKIAVVK